jgi:hypothetical protein
MKMIMAVYNVAVDEEVLQAVAAAGVCCYTKFPRVVGKGKRTGPRLDDHIWPGANACTLMVVPDELAPAVMDVLARLRRELGATEGIKAFLWTIDQQLG